MSLDIHKLKNGQPQDHLLSIDDSDYSKLSPAFKKYNQRTGLYIDPYGNLKLSSGVKPLISAINDAIAEANNKTQIHDQLLDVLNESEKESYGIIFVGD